MSTDSLEQYLLLLLSDSNLPTGGFIASSGLESYVQHGLLSSDNSANKAEGVLSFIRKSLHTYARLNLGFVSSAHAIVQSLVSPTPSSSSSAPTPTTVDDAFADLINLDNQFEAMTLNHIARRASTAQGVALLTLFERAFAPEEGTDDGRGRELVERMKSGIRKGEVFGHLPIGFAVLTGALGLSLSAAQHLFLFLHARSLLSSAIRLNTLGPYISHRLLLHDVRPLVEDALEQNSRLRVELEDYQKEWTIDYDDEMDEQEGGKARGSATTWPLGEILAARHDQLHSKIFNS